MADSPDEVRARLRARIAAIEGDAAGGSASRAGGRAGCDASLERQADEWEGSCRGVPESLPPSREDALGGRQGRRPQRAGGSAAGRQARRACPAEGAEDDPAAEAERAFRKIERLALMREQASAALRARLAREGFSSEAANVAVGRALACGLVDDARYAEVLVRSRLAQGRGAQGIEAELSALDIDIAVVPGWPGEFAIDHEGEVERALALLERRPPGAKNKRDAAYRRLAQRGFGASVASTAARLWAEANPD